ncbi:MAG: N-acetylornithine carbamoyltransferase, partial [Gammaproteobacteria bacterium]
MRHFTHIADVGSDGALGLVERAQAFKRDGFGKPFAGRLLAMLFFNPSLRTRASFEAAMI